MRSVKTKLVLIIEADSNLRKGIVEGLKVCRLEVRDTGNPLEAVKWLGEIPFDVVVTGIDFKIIDGNQVLKQMMNNAPSTPFLVMAVSKESIEKQPVNVKWIEKPEPLPITEIFPPIPTV